MSGIIILPIFLIYILFATVMYKATASKVVLVVVLIFPFWDLILKKGIYIVHDIVRGEPTIYAYPEKDKNGKVESLSHHFTGRITFKDFKDKRKLRKHVSENYLNVKNNVSNFIEYKLSIYEDNKIVKYQISKVYLDELYNTDANHQKWYEFIDKSEARYTRKSSEKLYFSGLFSITERGVYDTREKKFFYKTHSLYINEISFMEYIRKNIFWLQSASGSGRAMLSVSSRTMFSYSTTGKLDKRLFDIKGL